MALFEVVEDSGIPIWIQLRNRFAYLIDTGYYAQGDQLPSVRALAVELGINYHTVNKVYTSLEHEGYIKPKRGKGVFVSKAVEEDEPRSRGAVAMEECVRQCVKLGMPQDDIRACFEEALAAVVGPR